MAAAKAMGGPALRRERAAAEVEQSLDHADEPAGGPQCILRAWTCGAPGTRRKQKHFKAGGEGG